MKRITYGCMNQTIGLLGGFLIIYGLHGLYSTSDIGLPFFSLGLFLMGVSLYIYTQSDSLVKKLAPGGYFELLKPYQKIGAIFSIIAGIVLFIYSLIEKIR